MDSGFTLSEHKLHEEQRYHEGFSQVLPKAESEASHAIRAVFLLGGPDGEGSSNEGESRGCMRWKGRNANVRRTPSLTDEHIKIGSSEKTIS